MLQRFCVLTAFFSVLALVNPASAASTDWSLGAGGLYTSTTSTGGLLVGSNIPVLSVTGDGTTDYNGVTLLITDGFFSFTSGAYEGNGTWGSGGTLTLTGCIVGITASACNGSDNIALLNDDFQSLQLQDVLGSLEVSFGNITGTVNPVVAQYFDVPASFSSASFETALLANGTAGYNLTGTNLLGLIKADPPSTLPESWGMADLFEFLAFALVCFVALLRSRILRTGA